MFADFLAMISSPEQWFGGDGILVRLVEHLGYSALAVLIGAVIAVPLGLLIGHTRRGEFLVVGTANILRALPSLGLMTLLVLLVSSDLIPAMVALVLLAVPPLLSGVSSGVAGADPIAVDAGRALGMSEAQVLTRIEIPAALPLTVAGLRSATLQVIATATIAAYVNLGGLGRYIFDGLALVDYGRVLVGALLVTVLSVVVDGLLALLSRAVRPGAAVYRTGRGEIRELIAARARP